MSADEVMTGEPAVPPAVEESAQSVPFIESKPEFVGAPLPMSHVPGAESEPRELTDSEKINVLTQQNEYLIQMIQAIGTQVNWIGTHFSGVLEMANKLNLGPMGKLMGLGGKN